MRNGTLALLALLVRPLLTVIDGVGHIAATAAIAAQTGRSMRANDAKRQRDFESVDGRHGS